MRFEYILVFLTLVALASTKVLLDPELHYNITLISNHEESTTPHHLLKRAETSLLPPLPVTPPSIPQPPSTPPELWEASDEKTWSDAVCRGSRLLRAMTLDELESRKFLSWPYVQSPFDGDLRFELEKWGWDDDEQKHKQNDILCSFDTWHELGNVFEALGVDPRSKEMGGPNQCFFLAHENGKKMKRGDDGDFPKPKEQKYEVDGREYRATGAYHSVGINADSGIVYFLNRKSPEEAAKLLWDVKQPDTADLPALRTSSDLTWGMWNRGAKKSTPHVTMFMTISIVNEATVAVIAPRALGRAKVEADEVKSWPGTEFVLGEGDEKADEAFYALLGSPNGLAVGYFLVQHKAQLGGANFVYKITLFRGEDEDANLNMIFHVDPGEVPISEKMASLMRRHEKGLQNQSLSEDHLDSLNLDDFGDVRISERSVDEKHVLREHRVRGKSY